MNVWLVGISVLMVLSIVIIETLWPMPEGVDEETW